MPAVRVTAMRKLDEGCPWCVVVRAGDWETRLPADEAEHVADLLDEARLGTWGLLKGAAASAFFEERTVDGVALVKTTDDDPPKVIWRSPHGRLLSLDPREVPDVVRDMLSAAREVRELEKKREEKKP